MGEQFRAEPILAALKPFQRDTVEHVIDRFYRHGASRFLVADETGLGKTIIARGVIARAIEELQADDSVERIDIVYVCSNQDLARQNLAKLDVTGRRGQSFASRLTLLAKHSRHLTPAGSGRFTKPVNLISFTPGTSFEKGWRSGKAEERAMLFLLLERAPQLGLDIAERRQAAYRILQGSVHTMDGFARYVRDLRGEMRDDVDETVLRAFLRGADADGLLTRFGDFVDQVDAGQQEHLDQVWSLVGELRSTLARESVQLLEPDLVILDEFQRFRQLLEPNSEAGELAHFLYDWRPSESSSERPSAKTLLLSATPFKPFTFAEEAEDHHRDFRQLIGWLSKWDQTESTTEVGPLLAQYRDNLVTGRSVAEPRDRIRSSLLTVMSRTERPRTIAALAAKEVVRPVADVTSDALVGFVELRRLAQLVGAPLSVEYWKSAPYFVNFMDGYKIGELVKHALKDPDRRDAVTRQLKRTRHLDFAKLDAYERLDDDWDNGRLRALAADTVGRGWWKLLWLPPSLPYLEPGGPYAEVARSQGAITKRILFSSWTATPAAVATLLSYEADRLAALPGHAKFDSEEREKDRNNRRSRLAYQMDSSNLDRPASMSRLALFWPMPGLARLADPLQLRRSSGHPLHTDDLLDGVVNELVASAEQPPDTSAGGPVASPWFEAFRRDDSLPEDLRSMGAAALANVLAGVHSDEADIEPQQPTSKTAGAALVKHVTTALSVLGTPQHRPVTADVWRALATIAAFSPANSAYRALSRLVSGSSAVTPGGVWAAAAHVASALRSLFIRPEVTMVLDQVTDDALPFWGRVMQYCAFGNLQAVLDEYLHHLAVEGGSGELDDERLLRLARLAGEAISIRESNLAVFDADDPTTTERLPTRFALRYGGRREEQENVRQPQVRQAFNSPFWPFVLASTSVGQEGVDFHWWCHSLMHWNVPASPIDFEQREGRIDRYAGHAVRLNIAARHGDAILRSDDPDPWDAAYRIAGEHADENLGAFAPYWVFPGDARMERHVAPFALSTDEARLAQTKRDVAFYRLTFGQPRQEDMLTLLEQRYTDASPENLEAMRLDLSAPARVSTNDRSRRPSS